MLTEWLAIAIIRLMGFEHLFSEQDLALLSDWLRQSGELYLDLDRPHSGGSNASAHFIHSLPQLQKIVAAETHPEVQLSNFREKQYPIRGIADDALSAAAIEFPSDGEWFSIPELGETELAPCQVVGFGSSHAELREDFVRLKDRDIRFGRNPFDQNTDYFQTPNDVWVARYLKNAFPRIAKNWA